MFSISTLISRRAGEWADAEKQSAQSAPGAILRHMERAGKLRKPQADAIATYLWLKFTGKNRRLAELVNDEDLVDHELARKHSCDEDVYRPLQRFLIIFARENGLKNLEAEVRRDLAMRDYDWQSDLANMLHDFDYPNYLFSLPMGAGKTYLMAAFIAIDLHFSRLLPDDPRFAKNFIVFAPHAAKTAILPSLKTICAFDPHWVLPPSGAEAVRREMHVEILDARKAGKKSTRVNNPNLEKVNRLSQTRERGLVFITNAEKVVLEQPAPHETLYADLGVKDRDNLEKTNELRARMAEIPDLAVFLDEVHHAYRGNHDAEKKLRKAVKVLGREENLRGVIGFSGTPFVRTKPEVGGTVLPLDKLQDVVYDYPLARGIGEFLKTPKVVGREGVREAAFVHAALDDFFAEYDRDYADGTKSKIAFYCPSIAALNEGILPAVREWYAKNRAGKDDEIFSYYTAGTAARNSKTDCRKYPLPKNALAEFHNLDTSHSGKRVVLLVAVGKEGWDCRSLTAVALPRKETTTNFVLQAACRCLREVRDASAETALVCLGEENYQILSQQLRETHRMSVREFEKSDHSRTAPVVVRKPKLGKLKYTQVDSKVVIQSSTEKSDAAGELAAFLRGGFDKFKQAHHSDRYTRTGRITKRGGISENKEAGPGAAASGEFPPASYWDFLIELSQASWGKISAAELSEQHGETLKKIHARIAEDEQWFRRHPGGMEEMCHAALAAIASCFGAEREYRRETVTEDVQIELLEWKTDAPVIPWGGGRFLPEIQRSKLPDIHRRPGRLWEDLEDLEGLGDDAGDISFNYIPYRFDSDLERVAIREMLKQQDCFRQLELYYNGMTDAGLASFQIQTPRGVYTPDFLLLKREGGRRYQTPPPGAPAPKSAKIEKVLIIETKAETFYDEDFKAKERFVRGEFRKHNPNFDYFPIIDKTGRNDVASDLERLRREVGEWARA